MWSTTARCAAFATIAALACAQAGAEDTLFTSMQGIAPVPAGINSQSFSDSAFESRAADDFTVPATGGVRGWRIERIEAYGRLASSSAAADGFNVAIFADASGLPASTDLQEALYFQPSLPFTQPAVETISITLPDGGLLLPSGNYWLMLQVVMPSSAQFLWFESATTSGGSTPHGHESAWMQNEPNVGFACVGAWGARISDCDIKGNPGAPLLKPDLGFALHGVAAIPAVIVSPIGGLQTTEAGGEASFEVVLRAPPTQDVNVSFSSTDPTEGTVRGGPTLQLTFAPEDWDRPQTVVVDGVDDAEQDGDVTFIIDSSITTSLDEGYGGLNVANVVVINRDNDTPGFIIDPQTGLEVNESGVSASFSVQPLIAPTASVMLSLSSSDNTEGLPHTQTVFFAAGSTASQTVNVLPVDDELDDEDWPFTIVTGDVVSADAGYDALDGDDVADVEVTCLDDDAAGLSIIVAGGAPLITTEAGGTVQFSVVLDTTPAANVTLHVATTNPAEGIVDVTQHLFNTLNWDEPVTITVTGQDDALQDGNAQYGVGISLESFDQRYNQIPPRLLDAVNSDDEPPLEEGENPFHSADTNGSGMFELAELLRVVQLFNAAAYHCGDGEEDGFATGAGDESCDPHDADYVEPAWFIALSELLRMVQLFNLGDYEQCEGVTEDGFCSV